MNNAQTRANPVTVVVDGVPRTLAAGSSVAAALAAGLPQGARRSVSGDARAAFCGMGICHECRCTIDGLRRLACQTVCVDGMRIESDLASPQGEAR
jgi:predicted molibdopterin-dependent oxidoreductase YjgC